VQTSPAAVSAIRFQYATSCVMPVSPTRPEMDVLRVVFGNSDEATSVVQISRACDMVSLRH
jgi:hypothetical protein